MARKPSPWWWEKEQGWYVNYQGQRHFLGKNPEGARKPAKSERTKKWNAPESIEKAFRRLLDGELIEEEIAPSRPDEYVAVYLQAFLTWTKENRAPKTYKCYFHFLDSFERSCHGLRMDQLRTSHVQTWLNAQTQWNSTTKHDAITALQRAFNWCVTNCGLDKNPIKGMEKPKAIARKSTITQEEFDKLLEEIPDQLFRDLLIFSFDTGARPQEVKALEARHVDIGQELILIPTDEAKGKKRPRVIYIPTTRSVEILKRLTEQYPEGFLFRNRRGNQWTATAVKDRFDDLDHVLGRRVTHYDFRRTWITQSLLAGVDSHIVAQLAGHVDTSMIDKHYSQVADNHKFMKEMAKKGVNPCEDA